MAVTKVAVDADFAVAALGSDLQTSFQWLLRRDENTRTWRMAGKKGLLSNAEWV